MNKKRVFLLLSVLFILILFIFSEVQKPLFTDNVKEVKYGKNSITILLEKNNEKIIILNTTPITEIGSGNKISVYGVREKSINETIVFATKIKKQYA